MDFLKGHASFKLIEFPAFLTGTFDVYAVSDALSTYCCFEFFLLTYPT